MFGVLRSNAWCFTSLWLSLVAKPSAGLANAPEECGSLELHGTALLQRGQLMTARTVATIEEKTQRWLPNDDASEKRALHLQGIGTAGKSNRNITFITIMDALFQTNLGTSSLYVNRASLPHEWLLIENKENVDIAKLYARAQAAAANELLVFLHPDVILPDSWYSEFMLKLEKIETVDPDWGVLGTAGVPLSWTGGKPWHLKIASSIWDTAMNYTTGIDNMPVQSLDEHLLVLRRSGSTRFDADLPGFDLYGTDIALSARNASMQAYLLNVPLRHKTVDLAGQPYDLAIWKGKVYDPNNLVRSQNTIRYVQQKWCGSGLLPSYGTCFDVLPCG